MRRFRWMPLAVASGVLLLRPFPPQVLVLRRSKSLFLRAVGVLGAVVAVEALRARVPSVG